MKNIINRFLSLFGLPHMSPEIVDVNAFAARITDPDIFLLDVRPAEDYHQAHINNATNIPAKEDGFLKKAKNILPADKTIAVYCKSGQCSTIAAELLVQKRYKVLELNGGFNAWRNAGMPTVSPAGTPEA